MSNLIAKNVAPQAVEDDPRYPVKATVAGVTAVATYLLGLGLDLPQWLILVLGGVITFGTTFIGKNPKRLKRHHRNQGGYTNSTIVYLAVAFLLVILLIIAIRH